jgi:nicotinamide-nucleotide amidase
LKIEILCTGDEINYSHIARRLQETGFTVHWGTIVGDDRNTLVDAFKLAADRSDYVIVNGGLGPTVDDLSQEMAAKTAGVELELHKPWLDRISAWYRTRGRAMPENNRKQAMLPAGAEFIDNPIGTACGFALDIGRARFFFTPGVPPELKRMLDHEILPRLQAIRGTDTITRVKRFHTFGIGESRADGMLDGVEAMAANGKVKLGFQSHFPQLETKLTVQGATISEIERKLVPLEIEVRQRFGNFIVAEDDESLEGNIFEALENCDGTISVYEMHTGGNVTARLLADNRLAARLNRGLVSLDPAACFQDEEISSINDDILSLDFAHALAEHLQRHTGTSHALVVLTRVYEGRDKLERGADVSIAVAGPDSTQSRESRLPGSVSWVTNAATELALDTLRRHLHDLPVSEKIDFEQQ